jgi:hypothetical protein
MLPHAERQSVGAEVRLGFVEVVDLCSQDEIALRQALDLVRPDCDLDFSPSDEVFWVVPLVLRKFAYARFTNLRASRKSGNLKAFVMWCSSMTFQPSTAFRGRQAPHP